MAKVINIQNNKKYLIGSLLEIYEDSDGSLKNMETLDNGYLWEMCQHGGCWCTLEDVIMKDNHQGNFDLSVHLLLLNKYMDGLMQDYQREESWMNYKRIIYNDVKSFWKYGMKKATWYKARPDEDEYITFWWKEYWHDWPTGESDGWYVPYEEAMKYEGSLIKNFMTSKEGAF